MESGRQTFLIATAIAVALAFKGLAAAQNPVPLINQPLVPDAAKRGGAAFTLTVNGSGFVSGSDVHWNGSPRATSFVNTSKLSASIPASDIAKAGTVAVTVVSPGPGGGTSNVGWLEATYPTPSVTFGACSNFGTGNTTVFVTTADFNGDGKPDLAVADINNGDIMVMLSSGDGTFQTAAHYAVGTRPTWIAVGDFNGDGNLDLAVADGNVSILLGKGDGTFQPPVTIHGDGGIISLAVADFNRDGSWTWPQLTAPLPAFSWETGMAPSNLQ